MSKEEKLKELENEFKAKQIKMSEEIKLEIREELKLHEGKKISISEISQLTEKITKTKLKLFETEIADYLEKMKMSYDLGTQIKICASDLSLKMGFSLDKLKIKDIYVYITISIKHFFNHLKRISSKTMFRRQTVL